jgi:hypothetical protein
MYGVIRKRDVLTHPQATIQCFGWKVFFRSLIARKDETFLSLLMDCGIFDEPSVSPDQVVERCIRLERRAADLYQGLAERVAGGDELEKFLTTLTKQEQQHAELLAVCEAAAGRGRRGAARLEPLARAIPRLESEMFELESRAQETRDPSDVLRLVLEVESSEINSVFDEIVAANDTPFVRSIEAFRRATRCHLDFIARRINELEPGLREECRKLVGAEDSESR